MRLVKVYRLSILHFNSFQPNDQSSSHSQGVQSSPADTLPSNNTTESVGVNMGDQASTSTSTQPVQQDTRAESTDRPGQHNTQASSLGYDQINDGEVGNILILHIR